MQRPSHPSRPITEMDIDNLKHEIRQITATYETIQAERSAGAKGLFRALAKAVAPDKFNVNLNAAKLLQKQADELQLPDNQPIAQQPDVVTQSGKESIVTHEEDYLQDVRPVQTIEQLKAEIKKLEDTPENELSLFTVAKLTLLKKWYEYADVTAQFIQVDAWQHRYNRALIYSQLLDLLRNAYTASKKQYEEKEKPTDHDGFIKVLNQNENDHHFTRMVALLLKKHYNDDPTMQEMRELIGTQWYESRRQDREFYLNKLQDHPAYPFLVDVQKRVDVVSRTFEL